MRIGKFGEINNISHDTIRHYMELGLLVPEKKGGHYDFDENCQKDLDAILEFKGLGFSLKEIKDIILINHIGRHTSYEKDSHYQSLFLEKFKENKVEIERLLDTQDRLKRKIDSLSEYTPQSDFSLGVDLKWLDLLKCPSCKKQLMLQDVRIKKNQIMDGKLTCACGKDYEIQDGILRAGESSYTYGELAHTIPEYIQATAPSYLENIYQGLEWSKRKFRQLNTSQNIILELGTGVGFFLRSIYEELSEDCLYIAVDHSISRHQFLKKALEGTGIKRNVLFICSDFLEIPLNPCSVDILVDYSGTSNYAFSHEEFLIEQLDYLVKPNAFILGSYIVFKNFHPNSKIEPVYRKNFHKSTIPLKLTKLNYHLIDERTSNYIDEGGRYEDFFVQGEEVFAYSIFGKR